jgi:MarR family transcriptional regulator, organic hydroperoxide resistance regulator
MMLRAPTLICPSSALTADLTKPEREHLLSALAKIHRSALDLLDGPIDHDDSSSG